MKAHVDAIRWLQKELLLNIFWFLEGLELQSDTAVVEPP